MVKQESTDSSASRRLRVRTLSDRISRFLAQLERNRRPPSRRERYHLVEALQCLYEGRPEDSEAALSRAERVDPLPSHLTAQVVPSDTLSVESLREGLQAIVSQHSETDGER